MSVERARFRLQRELSGLEDMERDGHPDVAQAGRTLAALLRDDIAALDAEREKVARLERERDGLAAQLAALREAAGEVSESLDARTGGAFAGYVMLAEHRRLRSAPAASAPAVEAYTRRVQAEALESAATVFRGNQKRCEARLPDEIVDVADARREALAEAWCAAASECEARARDLRGGR